MLVACSGAIAETRLLCIMPMGPYFQKSLSGISVELGSKYHIDTLDVSKAENLDVALATLKKVKPEGLILMDTKAIRIAGLLQARDSAILAMPKFVLMTLQADTAAKDLKNVAGVRFEVPGYTLVTGFRAISSSDVTKVGVFYRKSFQSVIDNSTKLLAKEKIELVGACIDCDAAKALTPELAIKTMGKQLKVLVKEKNVQAIWLLADNMIINQESVSSFWLGKVARTKKPVLVPLENLASLQIGVGVYAADPDYEELGTQSAGQIVQVFEEETPASDIGFEPLISVKTILNLDVAKRLGWQIKQDKVSGISKVLKSK